MPGDIGRPPQSGIRIPKREHPSSDSVLPFEQARSVPQRTALIRALIAAPAGAGLVQSHRYPIAFRSWQSSRGRKQSFVVGRANIGSRH